MTRPDLYDVRLADLERQMTQLTNDVMELTFLSATRPAQTPEGGAGHDAADPPAPPVYTSPEAWVRDFFLPTFQRPFGGELRWCARWEEHPEAVLRLEAMWRSWEALHRDGDLGLSQWLHHHFDPNFAVLTSRAGPFAGCTLDRHAA